MRIRELASEILCRERDELLWSMFQEPLDSVDAAVYRLDVFRDLMNESVYTAVERFVEKVRLALDYLEMEKDAFEPHKLGLYLDATLTYIEALEKFYDEMTLLEVRSQGLHGVYWGNSPWPPL